MGLGAWELEVTSEYLGNGFSGFILQYPLVDDSFQRGYSGLQLSPRKGIGYRTHLLMIVYASGQEKGRKFAEKKKSTFWGILRGSQDQDPEESIMKRPVRHSGEIQNFQQGLHVR